MIEPSKSWTGFLKPGLPFLHLDHKRDFRPTPLFLSCETTFSELCFLKYVCYSLQRVAGPDICLCSYKQGDRNDLCLVQWDVSRGNPTVSFWQRIWGGWRGTSESFMVSQWRGRKGLGLCQQEKWKDRWKAWRGLLERVAAAVWLATINIRESYFSQDALDYTDWGRCINRLQQLHAHKHARK